MILSKLPDSTKYAKTFFRNYNFNFGVKRFYRNWTVYSIIQKSNLQGVKLKINANFKNRYLYSGPPSGQNISVYREYEIWNHMDHGSCRISKGLYRSFLKWMHLIFKKRPVQCIIMISKKINKHLHILKGTVTLVSDVAHELLVLWTAWPI